MQKAQVSLDLVLSILAVIIIASSLMFMAENTKENQSKTTLNLQLKSIAAESASFITSSRAIENTSFLATQKIRKVHYLNDYFYPEITINSDTNKLTVFTKIGEEIIKAESSFTRSPQSTITYEDQKLVIRDA